MDEWQITRFYQSDVDRQLFGEDEDGGTELDEAEKQGENGRLLVIPGYRTD